MKKYLIIALFIILFTNIANAQKLNIETKSGTEVFELMDLDSIEIFKLDVDDPVIYSVNPNWGKMGDTVLIKGKNFLEKDTLATTYILFDYTEIEELSWTDSTIQIIIPVNAVTSSIRVVVRDKQSNEVIFTIVEHSEAPEIYYIDPPSAERGDTIKIEGKYFGKNQWNAFLENQKFEEILTWSDTLIVLKVPEWAESGMISIEREGIKSQSKFFEIIKPPSVITLIPTSGFIGDTVKIYGRNFGDMRIISRVWFNGNEVLDYFFWSDSLIIVQVPAGTTSGDVTIRIVDKICNASYFDVMERVYITRIRPISGWPGDTLEITGTNFGDTRGINKLTFNGKSADEYVFWSDTKIKVIIPPDSGKINVRADVNEIYSNTMVFRILHLNTVCGDCMDSDGKSYKTVKIGNQCWMAENLNVGVQIDSLTRPSNNKIIEKHCYNDSSENCIKWGGFYVLEELLSWDTTKIAQGICPLGWRISTDDDWNKLQDELESNYENIGKSLSEGGETGFNGLFTGYFGLNEHKYFEGDDNMRFWSPFISTIKTKILHRAYRSIRKSWNYRFQNFDNNFTTAKSARCIKSNLPVIDSIYPKVIDYGKELVIYGKLFGNDKSKGSVHIEGVKFTKITYWKDTEIRGIIPNEAKSGRVFVQSFGQSVGNYLVIKPKINEIYPQSVEEGIYKYIEIRGNNFGWNSNQLSFVYFNNIIAQDIFYWCDTSITVMIPFGISTGFVYVFKDSVFSNALGFKVNKSCGPCIDANGKSYRTLFVGDQCWMGENLNVGKMIHDSINQNNNGIIEKYCKENNPANCDKLGGLYHWNEIMQYTEIEGTQGLCPDGWHIPSDDEWKQLEEYLGMSKTDINIFEGFHRGGKEFFNKMAIGGFSGMELPVSTGYWTSSKYDNLVITRGLNKIKNGNEYWYSFSRIATNLTYPYPNYMRCIKSK